MKSVALIGYSGHAFVIADSIIEMGFTLVGYFDHHAKELNPFELTFLGTDDLITQNEETYYFPSIGNNVLRKNVFLRLKSQNCRTLNVVHPTSFVSKKVILGSGNFISAGAQINALALLGNGCIVNTGAVIEHESIISNYVHIAPGAILLGNVQVGESSFIGANSTIKPGVKIGSNVVIGAGSVVLKDIPEGETWAGNPARKIK